MELMRVQIRVRLNGGRVLTGRVHIAEGVPLLSFLSSKAFFLNLTDVRWDDEGSGGCDHLSVRIADVVWIEPLEMELHLTSAVSTVEARRVELHLADGVTLHVMLNLTTETRMSDYLDANADFLPLRSAKVLETGKMFERIALNHSAILAIRELEDTDPGPKRA